MAVTTAVTEWIARQIGQNVAGEELSSPDVAIRVWDDPKPQMCTAWRVLTSSNTATHT